MNLNIFFIILFISVSNTILILFLLVLFNKQKILINEFQIRLNEHFINFNKHINTLSNVIEILTKISEVTSQSINELLNIYTTGNIQPTVLIHNIPLGLNNFTISFVTPCEGYLSIDAQECEVLQSEGNKITITNKLINYYIESDKMVTIKNIKHLKGIYFNKKLKKSS